MLLCNMYVLRLFIIPHIFAKPKGKELSKRKPPFFYIHYAKNTLSNGKCSKGLEKIT